MPGRSNAVRGHPEAASTRERVAALCAALPHAERTRRGDHDTYRVRGKVFAYYLDDHHGDGHPPRGCLAALDGAAGSSDNRRGPRTAAGSRG